MNFEVQVLCIIRIYQDHQYHTVVDSREVAEEEGDEEVEDDEVGDEDDGEEVGDAHGARDVPAVPHRLDPLAAQHAEHDHETDNGVVTDIKDKDN